MKKVASWRWSEHRKREFFIQKSLPDDYVALSTAVMWIPFVNGKLLLSKNHRWWEFPWWHIEPWETVYEALHRELHEEAGISSYTIKSLHGVTHAINSIDITNKATWTPYPKHWYIPFFLIEADDWMRYPVWEEMEEAQLFEFDNLPGLNEYHRMIIKSLKHQNLLFS